eukprot:1140700-Pelagomonas_calceolata.AAC.1
MMIAHAAYSPAPTANAKACPAAVRAGIRVLRNISDKQEKVSQGSAIAHPGPCLHVVVWGGMGLRGGGASFAAHQEFLDGSIDIDVSLVQKFAI